MIHEMIPRLSEEDLVSAALLANEEVSRALSDYEDCMRAASAAAGGPLAGTRSSTGGAAVTGAAAAGLPAAGSSSGGAGESWGQGVFDMGFCIWFIYIIFIIIF